MVSAKWGIQRQLDEQLPIVALDFRFGSVIHRACAIEEQAESYDAASE